MTDVPKAESIITLKKIKKPISSNKSHDGTTLLKDAKERIKRLQKKPKSVDSKKNETNKVKVGKKTKKTGKKLIKKELKRGVVYIGHVPHGFYEDQMKGFFEQFGTVTRVKVSRSPKTGKSKGYAFVEFAHNDVAKIVAETMNNYLMFERLVKAQYIPPEKVSDKMFPKRFMTEENYVALNRRNSAKARQDVVPSEKKKLKHLGKIHFRLQLSLKKLKAMGIEYYPQVYDPNMNTFSEAASLIATNIVKETETIPQLVPLTTEKAATTVESTTVEAVNETTSESVKETIVESVKETIAESVEEMIPESVKGTPAKPVRGTPAKPVKGTPAKTVKGTPAKTVKGTPAKTVKGTPAKTIKKTPAKPVKEKAAVPSPQITPRATRSRTAAKTPSK